MSRECCLPNCDNTREGGKNLFHVPAKKFCSGEKWKWADALERCIRGYRDDPWLSGLYKRDDVWICNDHFASSDILQKGSRKELRIGAVPTLLLPIKTIPKLTAASRPSPTGRMIQEAIYHTNIDDLIKSVNRYIPKSWEFQTKEDHILFHSNTATQEIGMCPEIIVKIYKLSLRLSIGYFGWFIHSGPALESINVKKMTVSSILHAITKFSICSGVANTWDGDLKKNAVVMHNRLKYHHCEEACRTPQPPTFELIAIRSRQCDIFLDGLQEQCKHCATAERALKLSHSSKTSYREKFQNEPLSRTSSTCLNTRLVATVHSQEQKMRDLMETVKRHLENDSNLWTIDSDLCSDLDTLFSNGLKKNHVPSFFQLFWNEQVKLNRTSKQGRRYHPELIRFCLSLALKSTSAYEELRDSGVLVLPSMRTLYEYRSIHSSSPGFHETTKNELREKAKLLKEHERLLVLSMDEIKGKISISVRVLEQYQ